MFIQGVTVICFAKCSTGYVYCRGYIYFGLLCIILKSLPISVFVTPSFYCGVSKSTSYFMLHDDDKAIYSQLLPCYANSQSMNNFSTHWIPKGRVDVKRSLGSAECYTPVVNKILSMKNGRLNGQWFWHKNDGEKQCHKNWFKILGAV